MSSYAFIFGDRVVETIDAHCVNCARRKGSGLLESGAQMVVIINTDDEMDPCAAVMTQREWFSSSIMMAMPHDIV